MLTRRPSSYNRPDLIGHTLAVVLASRSVQNPELRRRIVRQGFRYAAGKARYELPTNVGRVATALVVGQMAGYALGGADQLGVGMQPFLRIGWPWLFASHQQLQIPHGFWIGAALKTAEIAADLSKAPIEAKLLRKRGFVADAAATAVGQPFFSIAEATEKAVSVAARPRMIGTPDQIVLSAMNIYATMFRFGIDAVIWKWGDKLHGKLGANLTKAMATRKYFSGGKEVSDSAQSYLANNNVLGSEYRRLSEHPWKYSFSKVTQPIRKPRAKA